MAAMYGPLIDLSKAASHIDNLVQLLVFVHRSSPVQYKLPKGGEVIRMDIQVGDDTRPFFSVSLWKKQMSSLVAVGDVVLLQNVKITRFRGIFEATTMEWSSLLRLVHPSRSLISKDIAHIVGECGLGIAAKEKLRKVVEWTRKSGIAQLPTTSNQMKRLPRNWKEPEQNKLRECSSLSEILCQSNCGRAGFFGSISEIFLPITWRTGVEFTPDVMFISRRLFIMRDHDLIEDLICNGCQLCGSPLGSENASKIDHNSAPLYCDKSSNRMHAVSLIYRPFMLYVWDESGHLPVLVKNKAAEELFGNINAEKVCASYRDLGRKQSVAVRQDHSGRGNEADGRGGSGCCSTNGCGNENTKAAELNFFLVWIIILKTLLQQGKNSPLKFEIDVNVGLDPAIGRFEMVSVSIPPSGQCH